MLFRKAEGACFYSQLSTHSICRRWVYKLEKALQRFKSHEKSSTHRETVSKINSLSRSVNVGALLSKEKEAEMKHHREMLLKLLNSIRFLARQGLPFRGHREDSESMEGNLYQLLLLQSKDSPQLASWLKRREYISPSITNELITLCGNAVLRQLLKDISSAQYFSVIADEGTDVAHNEQVCVAVRWIDGSYNIHEAALGLVQLPDTKALTIFGAIKDVLIRCGLQISCCIGQAYDGASNMSGVRNGVQALMKNENSSCLYVHCFTHSLNLCIQDVVRKVTNCIEFILQLVQLINFSPKRLTVFEQFQKDLSLSDDSVPQPSLCPLCPTRWTVRHAAINSILVNYRALVSALEVVQQGHDEYAAKGRGLLSQMESFDIFFSLKLGHLVFSAAEQFSINLQAKDTTVGEGLKGAKLLSSYYSSMRNEEKFSAFYSSVLSSSEGKTDGPVLPRYRRRPRRLEDGDNPHRFATPEDMYRQIFFEVLDYSCGEIENRFTQSDLATVSSLETFLLDIANGNSSVEFPALLSQYVSEQGIVQLKAQASMLPGAIQSVSSGSVKQVTSVRTVCEALNQNKMVKEMLSIIHRPKLVVIYLTFPVTSATAERSFSSLRRVKTYLRSTMTSQRLNNLFVLYVHQSQTVSTYSRLPKTLRPAIPEE